MSARFSETAGALAPVMPALYSGNSYLVAFTHSHHSLAEVYPGKIEIANGFAHNMSIPSSLLFLPHRQDELFQMSNWTGRPKVRRRGGMAQSVEHIVHIMGRKRQWRLR